MVQRYCIDATISINRFIFTEMKKNTYNVLGVMSGTSLDGIDLAHISLCLLENGSWSFKIHTGKTMPYSAAWKARLQDAIYFSEGRLKTLNAEYTSLLGEVVSNFISKNRIRNFDAVCSHGHTILHQPKKGITLQIGNLPELAQRIEQLVVCDFRVQDVALGGQGAPLVPIGDQLLFSDYDYCLNLGGFANVSSEKNSLRIAYDICPVNVVLNYYAQKFGVPFDDEGKIAASGEVNKDLLVQLNDLNFYTKSYPKSLGLEWVQDNIFPVLKASGETDTNVLSTFIEHIAMQLARQFKEGTSVLATGGGVYNKFLLERLREHTNITIAAPSKEIVEYKEALIFGLLGVLKLRGEINCLKSVTGANRDHSSGIIYNP